MRNFERLQTPNTVLETIRVAEQPRFSYLMHAGGVVVPREGEVNMAHFPRTVEFGSGGAFPSVKFDTGDGLIGATITSKSRRDQLSLVAIGLTRVRGLNGERLPDELYFHVLAWDGQKASAEIAIGVTSKPIRSFDVHVPARPWILEEVEGKPTRQALTYAISHMGEQWRWLAFLESPYTGVTNGPEDLKQLIRTSATSVLVRK